MLNFKSLSSTAKSDVPATLAELFGQLDRKATHISLRPVQASALARLDEQASNHDVVIKLSTGSGKTVVGLVYAELMRRRNKGDPVLYLCPTTQLVDQVVQSASAIGVPVSTFPQKGLPHDALAGDTVLVCTYDRVFNARNVFESNNVRPSCIVLDDVHAGVERVRACYTIRVPDECFEQFRAMLQPLCEASDPATWRGISNNEIDAKFEVPYWIWANVHAEVGRLLEPYKDEVDLRFRWGNFSRYMDLARACISGQSAEISLPVSAVEENACYSNAKHRLFMSASIKDGSAFIADLDCDAEAFQRIIEPPEDEGAGERMMLATSLISPAASKNEIAAVCRDLARHTNVVVLTSSTSQAKAWVDAGATLKHGKEVDAAIDALRASTGNYIVFAQRFDGVDLPDDACRVLVLDGVPAGDRLCDKIDAVRQKDSPEYDVRTVNKFEQALGRAVRSSADYSAVLLVGQDIAAFIGKRSVRELLETRTLVQVDLGKDLVKLAPGQPLPSAISDMVQALLTRNEEWKEAHRNRVKGAAKISRQGTGLTIHERIADAIRKSWKLAKARNFQGAVPILREAANLAALHEVQKAELLNRVAGYLHHVDTSGAADAYRAAFEINPDFPRPEKLADKKFVRLNNQAVAARDYFGIFAQANAAIARLDEISAKLSFGMAADTVEQGLFELGQALGATASRPEKKTGRGPDDLWIFDDIAFCLEAKSEKTAAIHKTDAAQLSLSLGWCKDHLGATVKAIVPIFVSNSSEADRAEDIGFEPSLLTEALLQDIVARLRKVVLGLSFEGPLFSDPVAVGRALIANELDGKQIASRLAKVVAKHG